MVFPRSFPRVSFREKVYQELDLEFLQQWRSIGNFAISKTN